MDRDEGISASSEGTAKPSVLERLFSLTAHGTSVRTELLAGLTTFVTMSYIAFVNPTILGDAGMPKEPVFVATCLAAAIGSAIMGMAANYPIAMAPGMGLNAYFAYVIVGQMHFSWQAALGAVFFSGCCFLLVTILRIRAWIVAGIPQSLRTAITVGVGLFLAVIALQSAGLVVADKATLVTLGDLHKPPALLACLGFLTISALSAWRVKGSLLIGILLVTLAGSLLAGNSFKGIASMPPSLGPIFLALDLRGALAHGLFDIVIVLFLVELCDATGTLVGVARHAGLIGEGQEARLGRALMADSVAIPVGALLGTSSTTAYLESASGVGEGGRTGLTALTVAALFIACLFLSPLAASVPAYATAPALFYVGCLMLRDFGQAQWDDPTEAVPVAVTAIAIPFTYSIANGLALGFIAYAAIKSLSGRAREVTAVVWTIAGLFVIRFAFVP